MKRIIFILLIAIFSVIGCNVVETNSFESPIKKIEMPNLVCENGYCNLK